MANGEIERAFTQGLLLPARSWIASYGRVEMDAFRDARLLVGQSLMDAVGMEAPTAFSDSYRASLMRKASK
jgi:hypothetical protein